MRSGSTLLDQLLGQNPEITSVGELHWLKDYFNRNRPGIKEEEQGLCACGEMVEQCQLWSKVEKRLEKQNLNVRELETYTKVPKNSFLKLIYNFLLSFGFKWLPYVEHNKKVVENCDAIFEAIAAEQKTQYILESSKETERAKFYDLFLKKERKFIFLVRDGRGVTWSKMKRGMSFWKAAISWILFHLRLVVIKNSISKNLKSFLLYRTFCNQTEEVIEEITSNLAIKKYPQNTLFQSNTHNIGGSPYRFNTKNIAIKNDVEWRTKFGQFNRTILYILFLPFNFLLGHPVLKKS